MVKVFRVIYVRGYNKKYFDKYGKVKGGKKYVRVVKGKDWASAVRDKRLGVIVQVKEIKKKVIKVRKKK